MGAPRSLSATQEGDAAVFLESVIAPVAARRPCLVRDLPDDDSEAAASLADLALLGGGHARILLVAADGGRRTRRVCRLLDERLIASRRPSVTERFVGTGEGTRVWMLSNDAQIVVVLVDLLGNWRPFERVSAGAGRFGYVLGLGRMPPAWRALVEASREADRKEREWKGEQRPRSLVE